MTSFSLKTKRLHIRLFTKEDAKFVHDMVNEADFIKYIGDRGVRTIEDAEKYIAERFEIPFAKNGFTMYLVEEIETRIPVGMCGLVNRNGLEGIDLGFAFRSNTRRKGYALESSNAIINYAAAELKLTQLASITLSTNKPSISLLKKLGFEFVKFVQLLDDPSELMLFEKNLNTSGPLQH